METKDELRNEIAYLQEKLNMKQLECEKLKKECEIYERSIDENSQMKYSIRALIEDTVKEIVKNEIREKLKLNMKSDWGGYVEASLIYDRDEIGNDCVSITTNSNPLDE